MATPLCSQLENNLIYFWSHYVLIVFLKVWYGGPASGSKVAIRFRGVNINKYEENRVDVTAERVQLRVVRTCTKTPPCLSPTYFGPERYMYE